MKLSCKSKDVNIFRSIDIKLVQNETNYKKTIKKVQDKYKTDNDIIELLESLNKEVYIGKLKFDFCLNEGLDIENIKLSENKKKYIKQRYFDVSDKICKAKTDIENLLKDNIDLL